jgi:nucleotide-binding universal stress UspA family protein
MFKQILAATDGSDNSYEAVRLACELAKNCPGSKVNVVTAFHALTPAEMIEMTQELPEEFRQVVHAGYTAEQHLDGAKQIAAEVGIKASFTDIADDPSDAIIEAAEHLDADLIVMGSRGARIGKRIFHGSVSNRVLHHAPCSVLVIKSEN